MHAAVCVSGLAMVKKREASKDARLGVCEICVWAV